MWPKENIKLNKEILYSVFLSKMRNNETTNQKILNWKSEIILVDKFWKEERIKTEIINYPESDEKEDIMTKIVGHCKSYTQKKT